jgi:hypothetical protein
MGVPSSIKKQILYTDEKDFINSRFVIANN